MIHFCRDLPSQVWVLMELCECGSLQSVCKLIGGSMAEAPLRAVCADVLQGLRYLHKERRTVHRDVKGANVLLTRAGVVKIADFGVSTELDAGGGIQSTVIGSPHWMAPEVRTQHALPSASVKSCGRSLCCRRRIEAGAVLSLTVYRVLPINPGRHQSWTLGRPPRRPAAPRRAIES